MRLYLSHCQEHPEDPLDLKGLRGPLNPMGLRDLKGLRGEAWEQEVDQEGGRVHRTGGGDKEDEALALDNTG